MATVTATRNSALTSQSAPRRPVAGRSRIIAAAPAAHADGGFQGYGTTQPTDRDCLFHGGWHRVGRRRPAGRDSGRSRSHWPRGDERDSRGAGRRPITAFHLHPGRWRRTADRLPRNCVRRWMRASPCAACFSNSSQVFMVQTAHTAIANARAHIDQRLARWILMAHDRIGTKTLPLTHEFLALMLGVRRPASPRRCKVSSAVS
jgi:hypothetical protein